jgi:2-polyprenyl-6-methoxyphenol hydroxylase-like FAD-dependent oxidoreductase
MRSPRWSQGRVALLGDAAFCASPVGGGSASLALIGAYVLAAELSRTSDHRAALARYEEFMRPHVDAAQRVNPRVLRAANPRSVTAIRTLHTGARVVGSSFGRTVTTLVGGRLVKVAAEDISLPRYPRLPETPRSFNATWYRFSR